MKKLLILLIGFAFTQSIQTKQVSVTIEQWDTPINLFEEMGLIGDGYEVNFVGIEIENGSTVCDGFSMGPDPFYLGLPILLWTDYSKQIHYNYSGAWFPTSIIDYDCLNQISQPAMHPSSEERTYISIQYPGIELYPSLPGGTMGLSLLSHYEQFGTTTLTFRVTGMFEDDAMFDTGDLNEDGDTNVVDIVALVNLILGEG